MSFVPKARVTQLMRLTQGACMCPAHLGGLSKHLPNCKSSKSFASQIKQEYAFEMASANIRYGEGVTREVGMDAKNFNAKNVIVFTDSNIAKLHPFKTVIQSLEANNIPYRVYDKVRTEPSDQSFKEAIEFTRKKGVDLIIAVGGGSTIDTAKAANLYNSYPDADFLTFVNAPIGKGVPVDKTLTPLIAIPTTAGTGSETTGSAIFDFKELKMKTGIASRALKPTLGIVDPLNIRSAPLEVKIAAGLDVLFHSIESYTAIPYNMRGPAPSNPIERPAYQGSNPISDVWARKALAMTIDALPKIKKDPNDKHALSQMILAATYAGIGFGNAGVHLCHGMSYPISGLNTSYFHPGYNKDHPIVPHGVSVAITAPAVFNYTGAAFPDRHIEVAQAFGADVSNVKKADAGRVVSDHITKFLMDLGLPNGISAFGFSYSDINNLVDGTLPQHRVTKLAPLQTGAEDLASLFEQSMKLY
ncbi:hypothetical protein BB561_004378 [Smittium simulii]|uniref:Uncharacterized protein n=1 Tax=Smittium simulii TaxID=133385 RepID=A0A2T9YGJ4_9FUNG|nr:hypothetical protein BB561_004378 [Smittium simulii]